MLAMCIWIDGIRYMGDVHVFKDDIPYLRKNKTSLGLKTIKTLRRIEFYRVVECEDGIGRYITKEDSMTLKSDVLFSTKTGAIDDWLKMFEKSSYYKVDLESLTEYDKNEEVA